MTRESEYTIKDGMSSLEKTLKRVFDFVGSVCGLIVTLPIFLAIIIAQKIEGEGPVFYKQERIGRDGKTFEIVKFRTMKTTAEEEGPQLAHEQDERLTKVGKFLRLHHLDELPQLVNVLKGEMSFVGYRPEREYFINQIIEIRPDYVNLYMSRPGVTSNATLHNGYTDTMDKMIIRLDMDLEYLKHRSLWGDAKIIGETLLSVAGGKKF
ncbi:MAG: sugar transferase [Bacteroidaceae bacterium]|jgi:lipopolysaccharide/colanic/teichoic acid biosynthesis glycosyltransferase|nr:sugar transferase [Bacteroidaceae bacterium]